MDGRTARMRDSIPSWIAKGVPLETIRQALAAAERDTSLRYVAGQVGISPTSLRKFLDTGGPLHYRTREKLRLWYARYAPRERPELSRADAEALLSLLMLELPPDEHPRARREMVEALAQVYRRMEQPLPPWLHTLSTDPGDPAPSGG